METKGKSEKAVIKMFEVNNAILEKIYADKKILEFIKREEEKFLGICH